ncbi:endospore germination permease, partial [Paenibacillus sp. HJGM_3]|uniref:GerAB/ArcD/ProY family transporter n=1 Tax=Paenibacillus sp. HJGM_3 TaxID=3379816 RepID=UPI0038600754
TIIMHPTILATAALYVPAVTMRIAGTDTWMVPFFASMIGFLTVYVMVRLHATYPQLTFIEYCPHILGRWLGQTLGLVYLISLLYSLGIVLREYGEFLVGQFFIETPLLVMIVCLVAVCAYALYMGLEVLAKSAQLLVPIAISMIVVLVLFMIPDMRSHHLLPFLENGIRQPLLGSITPASWFSQFFVLGFLLPYLSRKEHALRWGMLSVGFVLSTLIVINISVQLVFGSKIGRVQYPFLIAIRYISLADFFQHVEALLMAIWLIGIFVKVATLYYVLTLGTAQWLRLASYRVLIIPLGVLGVLCSIWVSTNLQGLTHLLESTVPFYALLMQLLVPILLLLIAMARRRRTA